MTRRNGPCQTPRVGHAEATAARTSAPRSIQLVDGNGYHYIIQGCKVDPSELPTLGDQYQGLPDGWSYEPITYDQDLAVQLTPTGFIPSVQDE